MQDREVGQAINSYALVTYVPHPLGAFLDRMRRELVAGCVAQSHVTLLPPRPLKAPEEAEDQILRCVHPLAPFEIELSEVRIFPKSSVVYLELSRGGPELEALHEKLNLESLFFQETFRYHPHLTLAQDFPVDQVEYVYERALANWNAWTSSRRFCVDHVTFVQNTILPTTGASRWIDLAECVLGGDLVACPSGR